MPSIELNDDPLTVEMTANAAISDGEIVGALSANTVEPISNTNAQAVVGVANHAAASGEAVDVVVLGKKTVTADGAVAVGDPVAAAATSGRAASEPTAPATHGHTAVQSDGTDDTLGSHQTAVAGDGTATSLQIGVATSGQAAESVPTSTDDAAPPTGRTIGKALTAASAAGDSITVLVALTA